MKKRTVFPQSQVPVRKAVDLLPNIFKTTENDKFLSGTVDSMIQPGKLEKITGYIGRRYGKTYNGQDIYVDNNETLRSAYQLEPGVVYLENEKITNFYDYLDFKNQVKLFGNLQDDDRKVTEQNHYTWNPPIDWDKFVNFREYYWEPSGPPSVAVFGQTLDVISTYSVSLGIDSSFIFTPDGLTNNPSITLYRGQTYRFNVNVPGEGFNIRTNYDTGSLRFNPNFSYVAGQLAVFADKIWKATRDLVADPNRTVTEESGDWELLSQITDESPLQYNKGVTNNGAENGVVEFVVPFDAPDRLFYQGLIDPNRVGQFIIADISSNTFIDVEKEIIGKQTYLSSNGIEFTNGLVVEFRGQVNPAQYSRDTWLVEGVGIAITLTRFKDLVVPKISSESVPEVLFDNLGFDVEPFDDAENFPGKPDYITIKKSSPDLNPWSRYNRWFHKSVLEFSYASRGQSFEEKQEFRAKRPIIEFDGGLQLFNNGSIAKKSVDFIDTFTTDLFSTVEGTTNYNVDNEFLFDGARVLVTADTDRLVNNKIYQVKFVNFKGRRQISLIQVEDSEPNLGECVLVIRGKQNAGKMYHFTGDNWVLSQEKQSINQPPLFDAFDDFGISFSNSESYPISNFVGTKILSYKQGNGRVDTELGFKLDYLNIDNVGDILFDWNWETDEFSYVEERRQITQLISRGYYKNNTDSSYHNGWILSDTTFSQPIIDSVKIDQETNEVVFKTVNWKEIDVDNTIIKFYLNGKSLTDKCDWLPVIRDFNTFKFSSNFKPGDIVVIKVFTDIIPDSGYYEFPAGLEKNPLNSDLTRFTLGQATDHLTSGLEFNSTIEECSKSITQIRNLRDISDYQKYCNRFLKHDSIAPLALSLLCDKDNNIIKSIQYAKKAYTDFKNKFIDKAIEIEFNDNIPLFVDEIISELTKTKTAQSVFSNSDMLGSGAFNSITYKVEDPGIRVFALNEKFNLKEPSARAVYIYINNIQLLAERDYEFNDTFGFVTIKSNIEIDDLIEIREYVSTAVNFIPPTPTSMGLYKKYTPNKFVDDTYQEPTEVIQGHDGSVTIAFGDYRDDLLLELEYRIYNNIKQEYNPSIVDIDAIIGGYYSDTPYDKKDLDFIVNQEFLKWVQNTNIDYSSNNYFKETESFTYTYSNMIDPSRRQNLPGWWRGVYQWFYDTDRPHRCPWEMLGFSEQPDWWESEYGVAPYTSGNLILWEDLRDGLIRQGVRAGRHPRYARPTLLNHIPVDNRGKLLSPLDSNLAQNFILLNAKDKFVFGDVSPVEYAWKSSSEWPFAVILAITLLRPFDTITNLFDRSITTNNLLGHRVIKDSNTFVTVDNLVDSLSTDYLSYGISQYLKNYIKSKGRSVSTFATFLKSLDIRLSSRLSGFVDKQRQKYLLDSKNPASASSGVFIPQENYDIFFNVSSPISVLSYSGVIVEKTTDGWILNGYDLNQPYFNYFKAVPNQKDPLLTVGGVSANFSQWEPGRNYNNGQIVQYRTNFYRAVRSHNSSTDFDSSNWNKLPKLPIVGGVEALKRKNFNTLQVERLSYGSKLTSIQQVVDFLLGHEEYLKSQGFVFDNYDYDNQVSQDWTTSCKEFMFWTKHNWASGSLISLSPSAQKIQIEVPVGVAENLLDGFYGYQVLKSDGVVLQPKFLNISRSFQTITIDTKNTTDGIYFIKLYYVLKEHVVIFNDRTVFNDVIYDKPSGYRQSRIKTLGFRTTDWDGDYTSPGFIFDNVDITSWQPFTDYKLGDIVEYRSETWVSQENQIGTEEFEAAKWLRTEVPDQKQLVPNFDYKINQIEDYYNVSSEGLGSNQRDLARHLIGYQKRDYLQDLSEDDVTQFQLYSGFIRDKGTSGAIVKIFDKFSRTDDASVVLKEEWAFKVGEFGGTDQVIESEFRLDKNQFQTNPQAVILLSSLPTETVADKYYRIDTSNFTLNNYSLDINPLSPDVAISRSAGYVRFDQVDYAIGSRDDILNLDISAVIDGDLIWIAFDKNSWNVLRYDEVPSLFALSAEDQVEKIKITFNKLHKYAIGDLVGIKRVEGLEGFFKVVDTLPNSIFIEPNVDVVDEPDLEEISRGLFGHFVNARVMDFKSIPEDFAARLKVNSKLWIDNDQDGEWRVIQKLQQYNSKLPNLPEIQPLRGLGSAVVYNQTLNQVISSAPRTTQVNVYVDFGSSKNLGLKQILPLPISFQSNIEGKFGESLAVSSDGKWLAVGTPRASNVRSDYLDIFDPDTLYFIGEIVVSAGQIWEATADYNPAAGVIQTITITTPGWKPATIITANSAGKNLGYENQGMITLYRNTGRTWTLYDSFVSPRPAVNEYFGYSISLAQAGTNYFMAVTAIGAMNGKGRVYLYTYKNNQWQHDKNSNYVGVFQPSTVYPQGTIVWFNSKLWQAQQLTSGTGTPETVAADWLQLDSVASHNSLPQSVAVEDELYLKAIGIVDSNQLIEILKDDDQFGHSLAFSSDASILVVGAPNSNDQYFETYKGAWSSYQEYNEDDIVLYQLNYYKLISVTSTNQVPVNNPNAWEQLDDDSEAIGKVFIYKKNQAGSYELLQIISAKTIEDINDTGIFRLFELNDQLGYSVDISADGNTIIASAPRFDIENQDQGSVFVFEFKDSQYRLVQKLSSYELYPNEYFGQSVSISANGNKIVVGAKNTPLFLTTEFDEVLTVFEDNRTLFLDGVGFTGSVYVYTKFNGVYFLTEKLQDNSLLPFESFGHAVDCGDSVIAVGSPNYLRTGITEDNVEDQTGIVRVFRKNSNSSSWETIARQQLLVDISKVKSIALYDSEQNLKIQDLDYVDPLKGKILNIAEQEIKFKTLYDPAIYTRGTDEQVVDRPIAWAEKHLGELWWDLSKVKWVEAEQGDISYKISNWNRVAVGGSVDVYEWVESLLLPSEWNEIADTAEGIIQGISGVPLHPNDTVYTEKEYFNPLTGEVVDKKYYYWVKNKVIVPSNVLGRRISAFEVSSLISNPKTSGQSFIALVDSNKFIAYNFENILKTNSALFNIQYKTENSINPTYAEFQLLTENDPDSVPTESLETKWIDSLIGLSLAGARVPDPSLPEKQKYGLSFRPQQSMFINRTQALKNLITNINLVLEKEPFVDQISFDILNSTELPPALVLNEYDIEVDRFVDLITVGVVRISQAELKANIIDGEIDTVEIINRGFGYKTVPNVVIDGNGIGAEIKLELDRDGRVASATVLSRGKNYSQVTLKVRQFSVLVKSDENANNFWSIYSWDNERKEFLRSKTQRFNTRRLWDFVTWWKEGYGPTNKIVREISIASEESFFKIDIGDLIRVKEYGSGGWAVFEKINNDKEYFLDRYMLVGRENGTIQISSKFYDFEFAGIGYDTSNVSYDADKYDLGFSIELRNVLKAIKESIFVSAYKIEWNKLFFSSVRYAFSEQLYINWAFKTSFLTATHNIGPFLQRVNYQSDRLGSFREYIDEVKPFRTTVREYTSRYSSIEPANTLVTDFDLPVVFSKELGKISKVTIDSELINKEPWKQWLAHNRYSIVDIVVASPGARYTNAPLVVITGDGVGAKAKAYVSNGRLISVQVTDPGVGYTKALVTLVGGNLPGAKVATATPILGNAKVRAFNLKLKFDRITKSGQYDNLSSTDVFTATGNTSSYILSYPPSTNKTDISVLINNQIVISSDYRIETYVSNEDNFSELKGKVIFTEVPTAGDIISITYQKSDSILDSVNRIQKYYDPTVGMRDKDPAQLMTGIDFGGVQVQGTTFDITGGWDALPWFTDSWDSVESSDDYYFVLVLSDNEDQVYKPDSLIKVGTTIYKALKTNKTDEDEIVLPIESEDWEEYWEEFKIILPRVPAPDEIINVYYKSQTSSKAIRIDDVNFDSQTAPLTNSNALMPTIIGDGSTSIIDIQEFIELSNTDVLIFRSINSDGAVIINDVNLLDTSISGGMFDAYSSASGLTSDEIIVSGDKFISPDQVPAPEENIPGQVLDSVNIKVFSLASTGATPIRVSVYVANSQDTIFDIGLPILETSSVIVYIDKILQVYQTDYEIDFVKNKIEFIKELDEGQKIEIISIGIGGSTLLDYQEFVADGETTLFLTNANFNETSQVFVTVNGNVVPIDFINSTGLLSTENRTLVQFGIPLSKNDVLKIVVIGNQLIPSIDSVVRVNHQEFVFNGSDRAFEIDSFVSINNASDEASVIVEIDGRVLRSVDSSTFTYDGVNNSFRIGTDPLESPGSIISANLEVYVNGIIKTFIADYTFESATNTVIIDTSKIKQADIILIVNDQRAEYLIANNVLTIKSTVSIPSEAGIKVTWFSRYDSMNLISDEYRGGQANYKLALVPLSIDYVWVYKNGIRLIKDYEYRIEENSVYLTEISLPSDIIRVILFGSNIYTKPNAYQIHKDMFNIYHYSRFSQGEIFLTKDLKYFDKTIEVSDASSLVTPDYSKKVIGVIYIQGERIEYLQKDGNTLSQLRRGSQGTSIAEIYTKGTSIADIGNQNLIPYRETYETNKFIGLPSFVVVYNGVNEIINVSDNIYVGFEKENFKLIVDDRVLILDVDYEVFLENNQIFVKLLDSLNLPAETSIKIVSMLIGPIAFAPVKSERTEWQRKSIPENYGMCDQVEVFVAGRRLYKDFRLEYDQTLGYNSKKSTKLIEAEFSVSGDEPYIRITNSSNFEQPITVVRRLGKIWHEPGKTTASAGKSLAESNTAIAKFIAQKTTELPE